MYSIPRCYRCYMLQNIQEVKWLTVIDERRAETSEAATDVEGSISSCKSGS